MGIQESIYYMPNCEKRHLAAYIRKNLDVPVSAIGSINDPNVAEEILANGEADFIATARNFIADNELGQQGAEGPGRGYPSLHPVYALPGYFRQPDQHRPAGQCVRF